MCRRLRALVRYHSCWALWQPGGAILPPLSGLYHFTVDPSGGWAGLKKAIASCPEGGTVHAKEGEYVYWSGDMEYVYGQGRLRLAHMVNEWLSTFPPPSTSSGTARPSLALLMRPLRRQGGGLPPT